VLDSFFFGNGARYFSDLPPLFVLLSASKLRPNGLGSWNRLSTERPPNLEQIKMFENNELLDNIWFRMGVHTLAFWGWVVGCVILLYVR
jgi:hypothetical protein